MALYELNDQERVELIKSWWRRYGTYLIVVIVLIVVAISAYRWWQNHEAKLNASAAASYQSLLISVNNNVNPDAVIAAANALITQYPHTAYANLAGLFVASNEVKLNNLSAAKSALQTVVKNSKGDLQALARVRLARVLLAQNQPSAAIMVLTPIPKGYEALYQLSLGDSYMAENNFDAAHKAYQQGLATVGNNTLLKALLMQHSNQVG